MLICYSLLKLGGCLILNHLYFFLPFNKASSSSIKNTYYFLVFVHGTNLISLLCREINRILNSRKLRKIPKGWFLNIVVFSYNSFSKKVIKLLFQINWLREAEERRQMMLSQILSAEARERRKSKFELAFQVD